jgi:hypothetical protein
MKAYVKAVYSIFLLIILHAVSCAAQDSKRYPAAVLVQLRSEHNRIEALTKSGRYQDVEDVKKDALEVRKRMILDFHDHFHYCPVYYYIDTNADLIKLKAFDGVLLQEDGTPIKAPVLESTSENYLIVYYGYALSQSKVNWRPITDTSRYTYDPQTPYGKALVVLNAKFQQVNYLYNLNFKILKGNKKYYYHSKHFEIEYYPHAGRLMPPGEAPTRSILLDKNQGFVH